MKCILLVAGKNARKESCGIDQLCAGLEAGAEQGSIHAMQHLWEIDTTWKKNRDFYSLMRAMHLMRGIELACYGQFVMSGRRREQDLHLTATDIGLFS
jgi:hypothetical protein